jgi:hypothetical protein
MGLTFNLGRVSPSVFTDSSLNVGIGAAPSGSYKLEVTGTAKVSSTLTAAGLTLTTAGSTSAIISGTGTNVYSSLSLTNTTTGYGYDIGFGGSASIAPNSFYIYGGSSASVKFLINSAGNVGIGTSSPTAITGFTSVCANNATTGAFFEAQQNGTVLTRFGGQSDITFIDTVANIPFIIKTNSTERLRIDAGGLVTVIGTGSASTAEGIYFKRTSTLDQGGFISGSGGVLNLYATNAYSSLYGTMVFGRYNGTTTVESMRITSDGYVGIGTTAPSIKLSVAQDITNDGDIANGQFMVCGATTNLKRMVLGYDTNGNGYGYIESAYKDSAWTYTALQPTSGNVVIGTSTDLGYKLGVNGTAYATGAAGALSDIRHKNNVLDINEGLDAVMKLRSVSYLWNEEFITDNGMKGLHYGFIAQEVKEVLPDVVLEQSNEEKTLGLKYNEIIPVLVKAIQELNERLNKAGL